MDLAKSIPAIDAAARFLTREQRSGSWGSLCSKPPNMRQKPSQIIINFCGRAQHSLREVLHSPFLPSRPPPLHRPTRFHEPASERQKAFGAISGRRHVGAPQQSFPAHRSPAVVAAAVLAAAQLVSRLPLPVSAPWLRQPHLGQLKPASRHQNGPRIPRRIRHLAPAVAPDTLPAQPPRRRHNRRQQRGRQRQRQRPHPGCCAHPDSARCAQLVA